MYAATFYLLAKILGGEGSFYRTFVLAGWGFLPRVPVELLGIATRLLAVERVPQPPVWESFAYLMELQTHPLLVAPTAIGLLLTVYALPDVIWVYAVKHAQNLNRRRAIIAVNIPVGISVLLTANDLINTLG